MKKILSILLENESGALSRVIGLFSQRGYNIESLTVAPTTDTSISRMTIQTIANEKSIEKIKKQLQKLIDVLTVIEINNQPHIEREMILIKIQTKDSIKEDIKRTTEIFRGQIVDVTSRSYIIQLSGTSKKLDAFLQIISNVTKIIEIARSGIILLSRNCTIH